MRYRKPLLVAALVAAALTAVFVATPAIGGPSLAKLAKQVKKLNNTVANLSKQSGPPGPQGPQGPQGPPGSTSGPAGGDLTGAYPDPQIAAGVITAAEVAAANKDGLAGVPSLRTLGTGAQQAMPGNATPGGPPTGTAGVGGAGALTGTYPNPNLDVSGGPCPNGQELVNVSALAALTCSAGVYSDVLGNVAAGPTSFPTLTDGDGNSALGEGALDAVTDGFGNAAVGLNALGANAGGNNNSALGFFALSANASGSNNTAVGESALADNSTGSDNTAVGRFSLVSNTGPDNTAVGNRALTANQSGFQNAALGDDALDSNTDGDGNTAVGQGALASATTANANTALGENAGDALTTGSNNIDIKNPGVAGESGTTRIGTNGTHTRAFIAGIRGVTTGVGDAVPVLIDSAGQLGTTSSSRRVKRDIQPLGKLRPLMKLRPVSFRYRSGPPELHYGLIAEQVARVLPELAVYGSDGLPETVQYQELPVLLLGALQRQQREKDALQAQVRRQQAQINWLMRHARGR
jgi:hypothetical protein